MIRVSSPQHTDIDGSHARPQNQSTHQEAETPETPMPTPEPAPSQFELYDLRVEVVFPPGGAVYCGAKPGDHFALRGEMLHLPPGQGFSIYSIAAVLPLLAAKQRPTHRADWMTSDAEVACPDPNCGSRLRILRAGRRTFRHGETTATPLPETEAK